MNKPPLLFILPAIRDQAITGGEIYTMHVMRSLRARWDLRTLTYADVGIDNRAPAHEFARAAVAALERMRYQGPVLEDTILYRVGARLNHALHAKGIGPIVGFGQAVYPRRARSRIGQLARMVPYRQYLAGCDGHLVVGEQMAALHRRLRIRRPTLVVRPGFDLAGRLAEYAGISPRPGQLTVVTAGVYIPAKGQHLLVEAVRRIVRERPEVRERMRVECYGHQFDNPAYVRSLQEAISRDGLSAVIRLHDQVPQAELWRGCATADVFALVASGEGFPMVVGEAMLLGCVPLVTRHEEMNEMVDDGISGLRVARDPAAIARALERLLDDALTRARMSAAAREKAHGFARPWPETERLFSEALACLLEGLARA